MADFGELPMGERAPDERKIAIYAGDDLSRYEFGEGHPFAADRFAAFMDAFHEAGLSQQTRVLAPVAATDAEVLRFHREEYLKLVRARTAVGDGYLDSGDTPALPGLYEAALYVVGSVLDALERILSGDLARAFVPVAGLHHARPGGAAGFCIFNDCGIAIETLLRVHRLQRIAYVDIDAHHGDGVFYAYAEDPQVTIADFHEDGRFLYPGTGGAEEVGVGPARATKLNVPLPPGADDELFLRLWTTVLSFVDASKPEFVLLQCGADALADDPLTHLRLSKRVHHRVTTDLCRLSDHHCGGRLLALGGGGYNRKHTAQAWVEVIRAMVENTG
jgi:acetoin utilization protein AcuC